MSRFIVNKVIIVLFKINNKSTHQWIIVNLDRTIMYLCVSCQFVIKEELFVKLICKYNISQKKINDNLVRHTWESQMELY